MHLKALSRDYLDAFSHHLSSVIPLLLSLAEGTASEYGKTGRKLGVERRPRVGGKESGGSGIAGAMAVGSGVGAMGRFRAVQCLTTVATLPYSRLHHFKTQVGG